MIVRAEPDRRLEIHVAGLRITPWVAHWWPRRPLSWQRWPYQLAIARLDLPGYHVQVTFDRGHWHTWARSGRIGLGVRWR